MAETETDINRYIEAELLDDHDIARGLYNSLKMHALSLFPLRKMAAGINDCWWLALLCGRFDKKQFIETSTNLCTGSYF